MKIFDTLDLFHPPPGAVLGNHSIWLPSLGTKVPFQWGGQVKKRTRPQEPGYPRDSLVDEVQILRALAAQGMAPPIGELVFFREVVSDHPGALHVDPCGAYGYEMADAKSLPPGRFSVEAMRALPIEGSPGAWNDISVKGRDNVCNGYLVDVRRSGQDLLRWTGERFPLPDAREPAEELRARVHRECQFPQGQRAEAYQDFWLRGTLERGQRRVVERAQLLGYAPKTGESVLDIGCQAGGFLQYAWHAAEGRGVFAGVEIDPNYVACGRALARSFGQNLNLRQMDVVRERTELFAWARSYFPGGRPDHLLCLSLEKHFDIFPILDAIGAKTTYIETNGIKSERELKLLDPVAARGGQHVGFSRDRSLRALYRIERK